MGRLADASAGRSVMAWDPGFDVEEPFTRAEGLAAGITAWELRKPDFAHLHRNVYVSRRAPRTLALRAKAVLKIAAPGTVISHQTAALLWGGTVPPACEVHVRVPRGATLRVAAVRTHEGPLPEIRWWRGIQVTSPESTFCDLAETLDLVQLVVLGDRLVRRGRTSPAQLQSVAAGWTGPRSSLAQRAAGLVRSGVDSPPETRLRLLIVLAGLPEPTVNHVIRDPDTGYPLRRFELAYAKLRLAIEYEGRQHRNSAEIWAADIDRREELDRRTWRVVQVISSGLFDNPLRTLQRIDQARVDRGAAPSRAFAEEWRRYFPGRDVA